LKTQRQFKAVYEAIRALMNAPVPKRRGIGFTADLGGSALRFIFRGRDWPDENYPACPPYRHRPSHTRRGGGRRRRRCEPAPTAGV
jgi:hypothetical protein